MKLGLNQVSYAGQTIDIEKVITECTHAAGQSGFEVEIISVDQGEDLLLYKKIPSHTKKRIYISAGIHGDEPAGPMGVLELLKNNTWPEDFEIIIFPCLNPLGFKLCTRENEKCVDLNRDYYHCSTPEVCAHVKWLEESGNFDLTLCLHEDWEALGFYLYECLHPGNISVAKEIIDAVREILPIDESSEIDGHEASGGIVGPPANHCIDDYVPEAIFIYEKMKCPNYTLETPSDFPLEARVKAMCSAVEVAIKALK